MQFYLVPAAKPFLMTVQADAKREARAAGVTAEALTIKGDKASVLEMTNGLLERFAAPPAAAIEVEERQAPPEPIEAPAAPKPAPIADQVSHWAPGVQARKERLWSAGERVDEICDDILELEGHHLGNVAAAVAEAFKRLARHVKAAA